MSNNEPNKQVKKVSLQEAMMQKLASKQQKQIKGKPNVSSQKTKSMESQQTKRPNNQRRKTGM